MSTKAQLVTALRAMGVTDEPMPGISIDVFAQTLADTVGPALIAEAPTALTLDQVAYAVCLSEIDGSGHATGDIPCEWHGPENEKTLRLWRAMSEIPDVG